MTLGERIRFLRKQKNKSQNDIKQETGIAQTTLQGWECGYSEPRASDILRLCKALEVSVADLLTDPEDEQAATMDKAG
jgi:Predicted transcriptional regulators